VQSFFNFMNKETISFNIEGRGENLTLHLGMISVAEDTQYTQRFSQIADLKDKAKADKEYQIYVDSLAEWASEMPTRKNGDGGDHPLGEGSPADAIRAYFGERSNAKEWIAVTAVSAFRNSLYPRVSFL
jgi:hypothetical protein